MMDLKYPQRMTGECNWVST